MNSLINTRSVSDSSMIEVENMYAAIQIDQPKKRAGLTTSKFTVTHDTLCAKIEGRIEWRGKYCACIVFSNTAVFKRCSRELFCQVFELLRNSILKEQKTEVRPHMIYVEHGMDEFSDEQRGIIWRMLMRDREILPYHKDLDQLII